ncbi:MAG: hypothetical protein ABJM06_12515 [Gilvibacter sp.]
MKKYLCVLGLLCFSVGITAQNSSKTSESTNTVRIDVLAVYEEVVSDGYASAQVYEKLAHGRYEQNNFSEANRWFEKLFRLKKSPSALDYKRYATTLEALEKHDKAKKYWKQYYAANK